MVKKIIAGLFIAEIESGLKYSNYEGETRFTMTSTVINDVIDDVTDDVTSAPDTRTRNIDHCKPIEIDEYEYLTAIY